jgi:hypothetical protein
MIKNALKWETLKIAIEEDEMVDLLRAAGHLPAGFEVQYDSDANNSWPIELKFTRTVPSEAGKPMMPQEMQSND